MASGAEFSQTFDSFSALREYMSEVERGNKAKERRAHAQRVEQRERRSAERDRREAAKPFVQSRAELDENIERYLVQHSMHGRVGRGDYSQVPHGDDRITFHDKALYRMEPLIQRALVTLLSRDFADQRPLLVDSSCGMATTWRRLAKMHPGADFVGVDLRAQSAWEEEPSDNFSCIQTDVRNLGKLSVPNARAGKPFAGSVDFLFEQYGLTTVGAYPEQVLGCYADLLRPGGMAILSGPWPSTVITQSGEFPAREPPHIYQERFTGFVNGLKGLAEIGIDVSLPTGKDGLSLCRVLPHELRDWQRDPHALQRITDSFVLHKPRNITGMQGCLYTR